MSQLELATSSGISQRHISFLETGRSNPSRQMVVALCDCLNVPLRERNAFLAGAGFAPLYQAEKLDHESLQFFRESLATVIAHHEPYPALVLDGRWNIALANESAVRFFARFVDLAAILGSAQDEFRIIRLCLERDAMRPHITNWPTLMHALLQRCRHALALNPKDEGLRCVIDDILSDPDAPAHWQRPATEPVRPVIDMRLEKDGEQWALFTMLAHFGAPQHVTLQELSVESFYPADPETRAFFEKNCR